VVTGAASLLLFLGLLVTIALPDAGRGAAEDEDGPSEETAAGAPEAP
jgi:hypothetical protein